MSSVPPITLEKLLSVLKTTNGRDKFYRFLVYYSKFLVYRLEQAAPVNKELVTKIDKGAKNVGTARKLFRFGRSLEYIQEIIKSPSISDPVLRVGTILKSISFTIWMLADHLQWLDKAGYRALKDNKRVEAIHARGWLYGLLISFLLDIYKLNQTNEKLKNPKDAKDRAALQDKKNDQLIGMAKNGLDILIPATRLEILNLNSGLVGLIGSITSLIGLYQAWKGK